MPAWLHRDWCLSFVLALGHFVWQGTLIAIVLAIALRATKTVSVRYWLSLAALLVMAVSPVVTLGWLLRPVSHVVTLDAPPIVREEPAPASPIIPTTPIEEPSDVGHVSNVPVSPPFAPLDFNTTATIPPVPTDNRSWWQKFAPQLTTMYLCGVALMLLRLVFGLWGGRRLRQRVHLIDDPSLLAAMQRQARALGLKLLPVLAYCERVTVPTVVGVLKPMILLPLTLTSGLSPEQMESVLAHELAHLRRSDHLVNLLQRVIESLLFFHPALWWVSHRIRDEREHCCDDLVVACGAMPLDYAKSLLVVAELSRVSKLRRSVAAVSLLATGDKPSNLRQRISRLLGESTTPSLRISPRVLMVAISIPLIALIVTLQSGASNSPPASDVGRGTADLVTDAATDKLEFRIQVNNSQGKPVAGAKVTATTIMRGAFIFELDRKWCPVVTTDEQGVAQLTISKEQFQEKQFQEIEDRTGQEGYLQTIEDIELRVDHPQYPVWSSFFDAKDPAPIVLTDATTIEVRPRRMNDDAPLHDVMPIFERYDVSPADWLAMKEQSQKEGALTIRRVDLSSHLAMCWLRLVHLPQDGPAWFSDLIDLKSLKQKSPIVLNPTLRPGIRVSGRLADNVPRPIKNGRVLAKVVKGGPHATKFGILPLPGAVQHLADLAADIHPWSFTMEANLNEDGSFVFDSAPADEDLQIIALCDGWVSRPPTAQELTAYAKMHGFETDDGRESDGEVYPQLFRTTLAGINPVVPMERTTDCEVTVVDDAGQPLADAKVSFDPNQCWFQFGSEGLGTGHDSLKLLRTQFQTGEPPKFPVENQRFQATTNARGIALIKNLPLSNADPNTPTQHLFYVSHDDYVAPIDPDLDTSRQQAARLRPNQLGRVTVQMIAKKPKAAKAQADQPSNTVAESGDPRPAQSDAADDASKRPPFVVTISTERKRGEETVEFRDNGPSLTEKDETDVIRGFGTGIVIDERGYIATMHHLIHGVRKVRVMLSGDRTYETRLVGSAIKRGIAVLKIDPPKPLETAKFGSSSKLEKTDPVTTIGSAWGRGFQTAKGTVADLGRIVQVNPQAIYGNLIETDFNIYPSHSGGPLMNASDEVVGVMVGLRTGTQRISFAVPIDDLRPVFDRLVKADAENVRPAVGEPPTDAHANTAGQDEARKDVAMGRLKYKQYGQPSGTDRLFGDVLKADYKIQLDIVAGCDVEADVKQRADAYNQVILDHLKAKGQAGVIQAAQKKAKERWAQLTPEERRGENGALGDGQTLIVKDAKDEPAAVRKPGAPAFVLPDHLNVMAVGFDPDSQDLVTVAIENDIAVRVWDLAAKKLKREVKLETDKHGNFFLQGQLTLSGDRQRIIAILDGKVTIWDTTTGKLVKTLALPPEMQNGLLRGLTITPDLSLVACGRMPAFSSGFDISDADAIVWDVAAGRVLRTMTHANALQLQSIALSPDGMFLATGGQQAGMCLWDVGTGKLLHQFPNDNPGRKHPNSDVSVAGANQVLCLRFSPDSQQLALGDMLGVKLMDVKTSKLLFQCDAPFRYGRPSLVFSKNGQLLARNATDKVVPIWATQTGKLVVELPTEAHDGSFSQDSRSFAVGFTDPKMAVAVWPLSGDGAKAEAKAANTHPAQSMDWGMTANGLRARVVPVLSSMSEDAIDPAQRVTKFAKADDVAFVVELENVSDKPINLVDLWHGAKNGKPIQDADWLSQFACSVVLFDRDGKLIEQPEIEVGDPMFLLHEAQVTTLQPGKTQQFLIKTVRWLPTFKPRIQAGSYRVAVRYQWLSGPNAARIREANPRSSLFEAAAVNVVSAAVAIEVGGESRKADLVWGEAINGLRAAVSFEPSKATHTHGEKLVVNLNLQNVGTQPLKLVSDLWLPDAGATIENDEGEPVDLDDNNGGLSPRMSGLLTLKPQQVVALEAGDLGLAISEEQAKQLDERTMRKLIAPAGKYSMQLETSFRNVLNRRSVGGHNDILVKDAWVGEIETGATPLTIVTAPVVGLDFLKPYPKLHRLSFDMTEPQFLEIVKQQELKATKTGEGDTSAYRIGLGDGLTLIVMFRKDGTCRGIQRIRGDELPGRLFVNAGVQTARDQTRFSQSAISIDPNTGKWVRLQSLNESGIDLPLSRVRVSPDGRTMLFMRDDEIWKCDAITGERAERVLTKGSPAAWSPDGKTFVMVVRLSKRDPQLIENWIVNTDGQKQLVLALPKGDEVEDWSADGQWLAVRSRLDRKVYVVKQDGSERRYLADSAGYAMGRTGFSPDGKRVVYLSDQEVDDKRRYSLRTINVDGTGDREILGETKAGSKPDAENWTAPMAARWSPDGKHLAVVLFDHSRDGGITSINGNWRLAIIDSDGGNLRELKLDGVLTTVLPWDGPEWRPTVPAQRPGVDSPSSQPDTAPANGFEFLKPYPKLHGLSLDMTEPQFMEIVKQQELKTRKTGEGEKVTHHIALGDDHTLIVMFDKDGKCKGIQRVRGEDTPRAERDVKIEPLPREKKPAEKEPDGLLGRMIERPSVELLRELLASAKTKQPEPVALLDDGPRGERKKGSHVVVANNGRDRFAIVAARVRPMTEPPVGVRDEDLRLECAFVFDWQGQLIATLGGEIRKVRGNSISIDMIDVLRLGPEEDWFIRVLNSRDSEPLFEQTTYYRIANPVIPSLRYFHYPNSNAWSFGPEERTSRFGTLYFDFPTTSDKFKPREVSGTVDGVPVNRDILWDGDRNLFVGAPAQRAKNKPLYQVDTKWSKEFEPLSPKRDQLVVTGGLDERRNWRHACNWAAVVPNGFEAVVTLTIPQRNGLPNVVERRIGPALTHLTMKTDPHESDATARVRLWISGKEETFDMPFELGDSPEPQPVVRLLNPGNSAPLLSRPLKSSTEPLRFEIKLLAKDLTGDLRSNPAAVSGDPRPAQENPVKEVDLLQGDWVMTAWEEESVSADDDDLKGKRMVINGNVMSGVQPGVSGSMSFRLNPEKTPNEIDLTLLEGKRKGITELGIYKIEGDQLLICFASEVRPTAFTTTPGSGGSLLTLKKEPLTVWGQEVGGLQAGFCITNANDIHIGGKATVVIKLRNVGNDPITASAWPLWLIKPTIVDGAGKQVQSTSPSSPGFDLSTTDITLKPGQTVVVATNNIFVVDAEAKGGVRHEGVADQFTIHARPGKHSVELKGFLEGRPTVATGTVDFEVKADKKEQPNGPATKPNNGPANEEKPQQPGAKQESPMTSEETLRVLIDKVLAAHGGEDKLKQLTSFTMTFKYSTGEMHHYFIQQPMNFRLETTHRDQAVKRIFILFPNGRRYWTKEPKEEPKEFIPSGAEITNKFWLDHVKFFGPRQVLRLKDADHKVALLDEETKIGDRPAVGVQVTGPHYKHTMYFDKESHLLLKGVGSDILREVVFSDYKTFDGIPIARKENGGVPIMLEVSDFKAVEMFDAKLFEQPGAGLGAPALDPTSGLLGSDKDTKSAVRDSRPKQIQTARPVPAQAIEPVSPNGEIVGQLIDAATGKPVEGATIACGAVLNDRLKRDEPIADTDAEGRYRLSVPSPGIYNVWLKKFDQDRMMTAAADDGLLVEASKVTTSQMLLVKGRTVAGKVVDADGRAVPKREVHCYSVARPHVTRNVHTVTTKDDGAFEFVLPAGRADIYVNALVREPMLRGSKAIFKDNPFGVERAGHFQLVVPEIKDVAPLTLTLNNPIRKLGDPEWVDRLTPRTQIIESEGNKDVTGNVVDEFGKPLLDALVFQMGGPLHPTDENENGEFRIALSEGRQIILHAFAPGYHVWIGTPTAGDVLKIVLEKKDADKVR